MMPTLLLVLLLVIASPCVADDGAQSLGDRWYLVRSDLVTLQPGATAHVTLSLVNIPGGLESAPYVTTKALSGGDEFSVVQMDFSPVDYFFGAPEYPRYLSVRVRNESAIVDSYRVKVRVRGQQ